MSNFARYLNIRSALMPALAPDGQRVAFLSDITGNFQVWSVAVTAGQANWPQQLTFFDDKVWELYPAPAAQHLLAVSDIAGNELQQFYLISNYGSDSEGHEVRRLTHNDQAIHRFGAWSRDGQQLVYTCNARNKIDFDLYLLDLNRSESRLIAQASGNRIIGDWSPDGQSLLLIDSLGSLQDELYFLDLATGQERHLTAGQPPARYHHFHWAETGLYCLSDRRHDRQAICRLDVSSGELTLIVNPDHHPAPGEIELLAIAPDGRQAAYGLNVGGYSHLYLLRLDSGEKQAISGLPAGVIKTIRFGSDGSQLALDLQSPNQNPDIWLVDVATGGCRQLTYSNRAGIPQTAFCLPQLIHYPTFDGLEIPALYYRPQTEPPAAGYPTILYVHGGPLDQTRPDFDVRFQYFLSQGYAILATNVRGSAGYGRHYAALDEVERRMDSVTDLKHAVLWLQGRPEIDAGRIAIYGRSYGGFMVLAALTEYPDLFAAGIDVVGISNWVSFLERTSPWRRAHREQEYGSLAHHRDFLERISPIHKAHWIKAPLLVLAGDNDPRVPLYESQQVVDRVKEAGGIVEFIHYADEGHKFSKLPNRIDSFTQMAEFLEKYL
jgi:dipeptidyl aminopeptidase/acylaminoacyl peptidase